MSDNQNLEILRLDPGDIAGKRFNTVDNAVERLEVARQNLNRRPLHPLLAFTEHPKSHSTPDIWQEHASRQQVIPQSQEVADYQTEKEMTSALQEKQYIAQDTAGMKPVYLPDSEAPDELLRQSREKVNAALYEQVPQEDGSV